jgi:hypothetical protein
MRRSYPIVAAGPSAGDYAAVMNGNGEAVVVDAVDTRSVTDERIIGPVLARAAAILMREDPSPGYVGIVVVAGSGVARRCRTLVEQVIGAELGPTSYAGVLTIADLVQILGDSLSERDAGWLGEPTRENLRYVIVTSLGIRFAAVELSSSQDDDLALAPPLLRACDHNAQV